ncbi:PREDICTED: DNA repair protein XRCC4-like [Vollenhovia emeryi]|uniref:DNA repair protein XRCC4-like n=1 Tax=Vollenhovia emeryi TaxID=411798 RepID=UPI0005F4A34E|nr:PREDICTED: DNA repair protein XRCC4-like [Vollenhovia emeryi]
MINTSVSQLVNQVDKSDFTLYAEWEDTCIKIIVLRPCTVPLSGEMYIENANYFLNHLDESFETYLEKTKHAFSGKNSDIQFFLQDDTLTWKQQNILTRGKIAVHSLSNILILSDTLKQSLELYQECQERALALGNENEHLNKTNTKLIADLEEMTRIKTAMEKDIYMKFLLLLNTKKKRIKELQQALNDTKKTTKSAFDETTDDESDGSDVESNKVHGKRAKTRTDEMDYEDEQKIVPKSSKKNLKRRMTFSSSEDTSPEPSTSKSNVTLRNMDIDDTMKPKQILHSSEESEEDIFA